MPITGIKAKHWPRKKTEKRIKKINKSKWHTRESKIEYKIYDFYCIRVSGYPKIHAKLKFCMLPIKKKKIQHAS